MSFLKLFTSFLVFLLLISCNNTQKLNSDSQKPSIMFVGKVSSLSQEKAEEIWVFISDILEKLDDKCKAGDLQKIKNISSQLDKMQNYAKKTYDDNSYSFQNVKVKYSSKKIDLSVVLLDIHSLLGVSDLEDSKNYIDYKKIKESKSSKDSCKNLKNGFLLNYKSYYNLKDDESPVEHMDTWAKQVYSSIKCVCP